MRVDIPGYGEDISDPARLPPYTEDLGGGVTHVVHTHGTEYWFQNGMLHRDGDLPAVVYPGGTQAWYRFGEQHRGGGLPAVIYPNGAEEYWVDGYLVGKP